MQFKFPSFHQTETITSPFDRETKPSHEIDKILRQMKKCAANDKVVRARNFLEKHKNKSS